jgi:TPP-dependent pyruvate/acetoin dehydrogenase alpha subunit
MDDEYLRLHGIAWMRMMMRIRLFEEALVELYKRGALAGVVHLSIGQEAVAVGVCSNLLPGDQITSTHRGHGHMLARGAEPRGMFAEILGKARGYCRGKGGSMHVCSFADGAVGANGIVGGGIPIAVGLGAAASILNTDAVSVAFFGDGAGNQGVLYESLNLAALWRAPVLFICENNGFNEFTPTDDVTAGPGIYRRAEAFGVPAAVVDGDDVVAVHLATTEASGRARAGGGPTLLECRTVRWRGHHEGEESYAGVYRKQPNTPDPIDKLEKAMKQIGISGAGERSKIEDEERSAIERALVEAQASAEPPLHWALEDVFA